MLFSLVYLQTFSTSDRTLYLLTQLVSDVLGFLVFMLNLLFWFYVDGFSVCASTEVKEVKEKTTGRRRSTSRRKSNTNPEPDPEPDPETSQDRLSPEPEPDPDPDPPHPESPHPDPTVRESSPEPAPSVEEEGRISPAPAAPLPTPSPGPASSPMEEPRISPLPPSPFPDLSQVHSPASCPRPAPDPVEEVRLSPGHSPAPMEVDCSPSTVPMGTEGGGASPMEQSPALSPCSSPPVSPCLRLEDEDSLSPLFQRCLSEDSGSSPTPSLGLTKKR